MASKKLGNLEQEVYRLGVQPYLLGDTRMFFSNQMMYEASVYFLTLREGDYVIEKQLRAAISNKASGVGLYTIFFEKAHFEKAASKRAWSEDLTGKGIVAVFLPKYPFSQIKKITRDIQQDCAQSFDYLQEDAAAVIRMTHAKEVEKIVRTLTRKDPEFGVFVGDIQKSQLYVTSRRILNFYALIGMTKEQQHDFKAIRCLLGYVLKE